MAQTMNNALLITAIGMGLVFLSLILLWGLMELIVRVFKDKKDKAAAVEIQAESEPVLPGETQDTLVLKKRAAAAAVAYALAASRAGGTASEDIPALSPWQAALRSRSFSSRSAAFGRRPQRIVK